MKFPQYFKSDSLFDNSNYYFDNIDFIDEILKNNKHIDDKDFESFISDKNINVRDCGEDWKERGFAQRWWVETYGIYDWYWKHESEFNFV